MMKKSELKRRLRAESSVFVPDIKNELLKKLNLDTEKPKPAFSLRKISLAFSFLILIIISVIFVKTIPESQNQQALLVLEINPSFEIEIEGDKVLSVRPLNLDAAFVLEETEEPGENLRDVLTKILEKTHELGYLEEDGQAINILTVSSKQKDEDRINKKIKNEVLAIIQSKAWKFNLINRNEDAEIAQKAKKNRVSKGLMLLVERVMASNDDLSLDQALNLSAKELDDLYKDYQGEELQEFLTKYRENKQTVQIEINNILKAKENKIKQIQKQLTDYRTALNENPYEPGLRLEIAVYLNTTFPGYDFESRPADLKGKIEELLQDIDALSYYFDEAISEILDAEFQVFKNEIKKKLKDKDFNFEYEFQKELDFDNIIKNYRRNLSGREIKIYSLTEQIYFLINKNQSRFDPVIEILYNRYQKHLERADESLKNSAYIKEFEAFYNDYLTKSS